MIDVNLPRTGDKKHDGKPDLVRLSQLHRFASVDLVDEVIALDQAWRRLRFDLDKARKELNVATKKIGKLKTGNKQDDEEAMTKLMDDTNEIKKRKAAMEAEEQEAKAKLQAKLMTIGNILHESVPINDDEASNVVVRGFGERRVEHVDDGRKKLMNHVDLCIATGIAEFNKGIAASGGRGYYLIEEGLLLNTALQQFGVSFLRRRGYKAIRAPHLMTKEAMAKCAQLSQYEEELYKIEGEDKFLAATAEQPLAVLHRGEQFHPDQLPIRYVGVSTCFRKEAGSHGRDTAGIFRTHEFEKVEQFCITGPDGNDSWEMHEEMIKNAEDFYKELGIAGHVVNVVSAALNNSAAKKYDLEGWFPASETYRELVSCSNCTDYQARRLGMTYGQAEHHGEQQSKKKYVHILNSTLTATQRTLCCVLETYQREDGVEIPKVLQPYMDGIDFLPFKKTLDGKNGGVRTRSRRKGLKTLKNTVQGPTTGAAEVKEG